MKNVNISHILLSNMLEDNNSMNGLKEMLFAIEITLVGVTAGVLSIPYNSFALTVLAGGLALIGLLQAARIREGSW